jgi:phage-related protein
LANEIDLDLGTFDLDVVNDIAIEDINFAIKKAVSVADLPKTDGAVIPIGKRREITAKVKGTIIGTNYDDLRSNIDALKAALEDTGEQKLTTDDDRYLMVQYRGFSWSYATLRTFASFSFDLVASDPFWLSETETTNSATPTSGVGYTVANGGNATARCKITINANTSLADNIKLENSTTGELFYFRGTVANGDDLIVNNRYGQAYITVTNDGVDSIGDFEGDVITLAPGNNTIIYTGGSADVEIKYRDTYL